MAETRSLWMATAPGTQFPVLEGNATADVAVVGGGIAGICGAFQLAQQGLKVAVLEANRVCAGVTGYTTAKVTSGHQLIYDKLLGTVGEEKARHYGEANQWGLEWIAETSLRLGIECDLSRRPMLVFAENSEELEQLEKEYEAAKKLGLPVTWTDQADLPLHIEGVIRYENQVQFHPRKFVLGLAQLFVDQGGEIYERTRVTEVNEDDPCTVTTERGSLTARLVVIASHHPVYDPSMLFARLAPYRDYALAAKLRGPVPQSMSIGAGEKSKAFRVQPSAEGELLIVSGETHKVGQEPDTEACYSRLECYTRQHFEVESIPYRWSTQDNMTLDSMPYIGKISSGSERCFLVTGFGAWGMATAAYSGKIISELASGVETAWARTFDPNRLGGFEGVKTAATENANAVRHMIGDKFTDTEDKQIEELAPGEAAILKVDGEKVAAFRDQSGQLHAVSPVCTHMGCDVAWNPAEESWDCPCHGSRYAPTGEVIQGPAVKDLVPKLVELAQEAERNRHRLL